MEKTVVARQCVHARYAPSKTDYDDVILVKEKVHYSDGTVEPNIRLIKNYQREFYVTKKGFRNHQQKKEWESIDKLDRYVSTQRNLASGIAKALHKPIGYNLRTLNNSPYVYGTDVTTENIIKYEYTKRWPDHKSPWTLAVMDFETDVVHGSHTIISGSISFKNKAAICYRTDFLDASGQTIDNIKKAFDLYLGTYKNERNIDLEIVPCNTELEVIKQLIDRAHRWQPDLVGFWNITFDMEKMLDAFKRYNIDPAQILSHPSVEPKYRHFYWKKKDPKKETLSGKKKNVNYDLMWHKTRHMAGFFFVDMKNLYAIVRIGDGRRGSYKLNDVLKDELNLTKLNFSMADHLSDLKWHEFMQTNYKIEYMIYNIFDCISVELLDEKNYDASQVMPELLGYSEVNTFDSNPRKLADDLHFYCLENQLVMGSTPDNTSEDDDKLQLDKSGWIVTLASHLIQENNGLHIINEDATTAANLYAMVADLDIEGTYPTAEIILNVSKETTKRELCKIQGKDESSQRRMGLNMTNPMGNANEIACDILDLPTYDNLLIEIDLL